MGSWSVSCGISNIAITSGNKCVLVPLRENKGTYGYFQYIPATLPIFGEYDDYGGIENIEKNSNTELIEKVTGVPIEDFCTFLVDGRYTYDRDEAKEVREKMNDESAENLRFMWIDRKVYDFMSSHSTNDSGGCIGYRFVLEKLGFTKLDTTVEGRFKDVWERDGKKVYSDGTWIQGEDKKTIFHIDGRYSNLSTYFDLTEKELQQDENLFSFYENMNEYEARKHLLRLITRRESFSLVVRDFESLKEKFKDDENMLKYIKAINGDQRGILNRFHQEYCDNIILFKKELSSLGIFYGNLHCMSGTFRPHELYLTPQCGEYEQHQVLLDKFAEINKSYIQEYED